MTTRQNSRGQGRRKLENPKIPITILVPKKFFSKNQEGTDEYVSDRDSFKESIINNIHLVKSCIGGDNKVNRVDFVDKDIVKVAVTFYIEKNHISEYDKDHNLFRRDKNIFRAKIYNYIIKNYL